MSDLHYLLVAFCGAPVDNPMGSPIGVALEAIQVRNFGDLLLLSRDDIMDLKAGDGTPIPLIGRKLLLASVQIFHRVSHKSGQAVSVKLITKRVFDGFRVSNFKPHAEIIPFEEIRDVSKSQREIELWTKTNRISRSDFKEFRDEANWTKFQKGFMHNLEAMALQHIVDENHDPVNKTLDKIQQCWVFKTMEDTFIDRKSVV